MAVRITAKSMERTTSKKRIKPGTQLVLPVGTPHRKAKDGSRRGGKRVGAGRKPNGTTAMVSHARRPSHKAAHPLHVSMKVMPDVPNLRQPRLVTLITQAMRQVHASQRDVFRVVEFSIQDTHIHLVAEAKDKRTLSRGMASLSIRIARAINRTVGRSGKVWRDRYHARCLTVPKDVRNALVYVQLNSNKHNIDRLASGRQQTNMRILVDARCTSAPWFQGFSPQCATELQQTATAPPPNGANEAPPIAVATSWLLTTGWRKHGLINPRRDGPKR